MDPLTRKKRDYLRRVRRCLTLPRPEKKRLLDTARQAVDAFVEENPQADDVLWRSALGTPEELAAQLMEPYDLDEVKVSLRKHTHLVKIGIAISILFLACISLFCYWYSTTDGYIIVRTHEYVDIKDLPSPRSTTIIRYHYNEKSVN